MHPYQKYPSAYKTYAYPESAVPQTPFDVAYGSSLLPRQLLVSSPFVQVASPLPSPGHHHFPYRGVPGSAGGAPTYIMAPPPPKLSLPPQGRKRGLKQQQYQLHHHHNDIDNTPLKSKYKSISSSTSSLDDSTFDIQFGRTPSSGNYTEDGVPAHLYTNPANQSSSSSLYQPPNNISQTQLNGGALQLSKSPARCIMLMGVDPSLALTDFLDFITFGPLEGVRVIENYPEDGTNSVCLTFLKMETCLNFYNNLLTYFARFKKLINSPNLSISFVLCKKLLPFISNAINNDGATRNVYIGNLNALDKPVTREFLSTEFNKFGIIEKIDLIQRPRPDSDEDQEAKTLNGDDDKTQDEDQEESIRSNDEIFAFIHFTSIASAIKAVEQVSLNIFWQPCKIFYGTDRCSMQNDSMAKSLTDESPSEDEEQAATNRFFDSNFIREEDENDLSNVQYFYPQHFPHSEEDIANALSQQSQAVMAVASTAGGAQNIGNRTICLSNLDPKTKVEEICNVVRGGILQSIKLIEGRKICFITFVEPAAAAQFFANSNIHPIILHGRRVKVGWGKHSGPLPNSIALAVTVGASRNVYIGIKEEDLENPKEQLPDEESLRADFSDFGDIEQVNYFKQNRCVFLNFHSVLSAIKVVDDANGIHSNDFHEHFGGRFKNFKISFGKDRCGNPPKTKKKKNRKRKNMHEKKESDEIESQQVEVEEVPAELFASMGITSKDDVEEESVEKDANVAAVAGAFGITTAADEESSKAVEQPSKEYGIPDYLSISSSDSSEGEIIFTNPQPSFKPQHGASDASSGRDKTYKPQQPHLYKHKKSQSFTPQMNGSRASSRVSSHASLNSLYFAREPEPMYYKSVPFAPPMIQSRAGAFASNHPSNYRQQQQHHAAFSTNGSQVMAQYLAQSQHSNMVYAANVLNADVDYFEDEYGNAYRRTNRVRR